MLTQDRLKELLTYDPETGDFTRAVSRRGHYKGSKAGGLNSDGYIRTLIDGKRYLTHRLAFLFMTGSFPKDHTDHIDHDRTNNKWANLRQATRTENNRNLTKSKRNTSGYTGVYWDGAMSKWRAALSIDGKNTYLGYYGCVHEAGEAVKKARLDAGYHQNHGMEKPNK